MKSLPPSLASSPNTTLKLAGASQSSSEVASRAKKAKGTITYAEMPGSDLGIAKARKMLDMSQTELNNSSSEIASTNVPVQGSSEVSPALPRIPTTVTIPTMMKQPMPLMPTVPLPQSSLRAASSSTPSTKVSLIMIYFRAKASIKRAPNAVS